VTAQNHNIALLTCLLQRCTEQYKQDQSFDNDDENTYRFLILICNNILHTKEEASPQTTIFEGE